MKVIGNSQRAGSVRLNITVMIPNVGHSLEKTRVRSAKPIDMAKGIKDGLLLLLEIREYATVQFPIKASIAKDINNRGRMITSVVS